MRNVTFLLKSIFLPNKFTITDIKTKNEIFILGGAFIGLSKYGDLALFAITATLPFKGAKLLLGRKKTWLNIKPEILEIGKRQILL